MIFRVASSVFIQKFSRGEKQGREEGDIELFITLVHNILL